MGGQNNEIEIKGRTTPHIAEFSWKAKPLLAFDSEHSSSQNDQPNDGNSIDSQARDSSERRLPDVTLQRLEGWPTEFPSNLTEYRNHILNEMEWADDAAKHKAEIAPWVWHNRGIADILEHESLSDDIRIASQAQNEMAARGIVPYYKRRANASFVVLIRNRELSEFRATLRQLEDRFNARHHYPYLFLNDEPFTEEFMRMVAASTTSNVTFALIPRDHWSQPSFIDTEEAARARAQMAANGVMYGGSESYRHMCRFNSGFFYKHPLLADVDWYWRVEPGVDFYCDLSYDPFLYMRDNGKVYSFVIALKELEETIPTLWEHTLEFMIARNVSSDLMPFFVASDGDYNLCHFWSNFEIASLEWLRSPQYEAYFEYLDKAQGFFMERWGDAPVHSLAAAMMLRKDQVHFFNDIGYRHADFARCPDTTADLDIDLRCNCPVGMENFDNSRGSCLSRWKAYVPGVWESRDSIEALRLLKDRKRFSPNKEPRIITERRRWYNFFANL